MSGDHTDDRPRLIDLRLGVDVYDADGELVDSWEQGSDSFVVQFLEILRAGFNDSNQSGVTDTSGSSQTVGNPAGQSKKFLKINAGSGSSSFGLAIGSDGSAVSISDNSLGSRLVTDIDHGGTSVSSISTGSGSATLDVQRTFTNNTGGDITVAEVGMITDTSNDTGVLQEFLLARDTISATTIADGGAIGVTYTVEVTA